MKDPAKLTDAQRYSLGLPSRRTTETIDRLVDQGVEILKRLADDRRRQDLSRPGDNHILGIGAK